MFIQETVFGTEIYCCFWYLFYCYSFYRKCRLCTFKNYCGVIRPDFFSFSCSFVLYSSLFSVQYIASHLWTVCPFLLYYFIILLYLCNINFDMKHAYCPKSFGPIYLVAYYIILVKTSQYITYLYYLLSAVFPSYLYMRMVFYVTVLISNKLHS